MYTANFVNTKKHIDKIEYKGTTYTGTDCVGKLCRDIGEGMVTIYRDGKPILMVDAAKRAKKTLLETNKQGFRWIQYSKLDLNTVVFQQ